MRRGKKPSHGHVHAVSFSFRSASDSFFNFTSFLHSKLFFFSFFSLLLIAFLSSFFILFYILRSPFSSFHNQKGARKSFDAFLLPSTYDATHNISASSNNYIPHNTSNRIKFLLFNCFDVIVLSYRIRIENTALDPHSLVLIYLNPIPNPI